MFCKIGVAEQLLQIYPKVKETMLSQRVLTEMVVIFYARKLTEEINYML
jgi:hypothetical protein